LTAKIATLRKKITTNQGLLKKSKDADKN
jgi:colicin import membrane protein